MERRVRKMTWGGLGLAAAHLYLIAVVGWGVLRLLFWDRWWWLFLLNTFAIYLFLPLPLAAGAAGFTRRRELWIGCGLVVMLGVGLFGPSFLPRRPASRPETPTLTVMTYNMLGYNAHPQDVVEALLAADADLVAIQELNPAAAREIQRQLSDDYPYQILDPQEGVVGMGVISRYPLTEAGETLPGQWIGTPQVLRLDFDGAPITVLHFHPYPTMVGAPAMMEALIRAREEQVQAVIDFVKAHPGPVIAPVDFNAGEWGGAYTLLTSQLHDAWRGAGWGLGHTFPGADSPGSSRASVGGIAVPMWLVRIDYIFHSDDFRSLAAHLGPWDGVSDHRPVIAALTWAD